MSEAELHRLLTRPKERYPRREFFRLCEQVFTEISTDDDTRTADEILSQCFTTPGTSKQQPHILTKANVIFLQSIENEYGAYVFNSFFVCRHYDPNADPRLCRKLLNTLQMTFWLDSTTLRTSKCFAVIELANRLANTTVAPANVLTLLALLFRRECEFSNLESVPKEIRVVLAAQGLLSLPLSRERALVSWDPFEITAAAIQHSVIPPPSVFHTRECSGAFILWFMYGQKILSPNIFMKLANCAQVILKGSTKAMPRRLLSPAVCRMIDRLLKQSVGFRFYEFCLNFLTTFSQSTMELEITAKLLHQVSLMPEIVDPDSLSEMWENAYDLYGCSIPRPFKVLAMKALANFVPKMFNVDENAVRYTVEAFLTRGNAKTGSNPLQHPVVYFGYLRNIVAVKREMIDPALCQSLISAYFDTEHILFDAAVQLLSLIANSDGQVLFNTGSGKSTDLVHHVCGLIFSVLSHSPQSAAINALTSVVINCPYESEWGQIMEKLVKVVPQTSDHKMLASVLNVALIVANDHYDSLADRPWAQEWLDLPVPADWPIGVAGPLQTLKSLLSH